MSKNTDEIPTAGAVGSALELPDKPGEWTAEHKDFGDRRWNAVVTYADDQTLQAFMACNIREYPVSELNANGWQNWKPLELDPKTHCLYCDGWGFLDTHGDTVDCPDCDGTQTRTS